MTMSPPGTGRGTHVTELPKANSDDALSNSDFIMKYQLHFTRYFGPKYVHGIQYIDDDFNSYNKEITVTARVRVPHTCTRGKFYRFTVSIDKFRNWRENVKLFAFVQKK